MGKYSCHLCQCDTGQILKQEFSGRLTTVYNYRVLAQARSKNLQKYKLTHSRLRKSHNAAKLKTVPTNYQILIVVFTIILTL